MKHQSSETFCILPIGHASPHLYALQSVAVGWKCGVAGIDDDSEPYWAGLPECE